MTSGGSTVVFHSLRRVLILVAMIWSVEVYASEPEVVLIVGDEHFVRYELDEVINGFLPAAVFHGGVSEEKRKQYARKAIDVLIDRALLYQEAYRTGIRVAQAEVDAVIEKNIEQFGSAEEFEAAVKKSGLTLKRFKHRIVQQQSINEYIQSGLVKQSRYSEEELRAYYDEHSEEFDRPESIGLWHIILKVKPGDKQSVWDEKKKLAEDIVKRTKNGEDFAGLAAEYSEDDYRVKGGWIGYVHKGYLLKEMEQIAFELKKGEVSAPIRSLQGYHIIKAAERKQAGKVSFEQVVPSLRQRLEKERFEQLRTGLLGGLKQKAEIRVLIDVK